MRLEARVAELVGAEALNGAGAVGDRHLLGGGHRGSVDGPVADAHFADRSASRRDRACLVVVEPTAVRRAGPNILPASARYAVACAAVALHDHLRDLSAIARSRGEGHAKAPIERFAGPARPLVTSTTPGHRQNQSRQNPKLHVRSSLSMRTDQLAKTVVKGAA